MENLSAKPGATPGGPALGPPNGESSLSRPSGTLAHGMGEAWGEGRFLESGQSLTIRGHAARTRPWLIAALQRAVRLIVLGVLLALFYAWGAPRFYPAAGVADFWRGTLHGALMPMALPALLAGRDVPIYAERNTGRPYKLGYIAGINACGFVVFGMLFLSPRKPASPA